MFLETQARAEDVAQEVYLQAWKSFHRFEPGTNCRAWLFKILFHCVNHHRRKWFRFPMLKETEEFIEANLTYAEPIPEHLTDEDILAALDRIPADFRAVILMVDVEEFAYKEAAEILAHPDRNHHVAIEPRPETIERSVRSCCAILRDWTF